MTPLSSTGRLEQGAASPVTLIISQNTIAASRAPDGGPDPPSPAGWPDQSESATRTTAAAFRAATRALDRVLAQAEADAAAGGCAHAGESPAYRPPPRLREFVIARDVTCRSPVCRRPAWRADLDHTVPYDPDGRTCCCNLGGGCRKHHILKQHRRWKLEQTRPGFFIWTTPGGRTYTAGPDVYVA